MVDKVLSPEELARNRRFVRFIPDWLNYFKVPQRALAEHLNLSEPQVSKLLRGKQTMSSAQFQLIAEMLGISWEEMFMSPEDRRRGALYREVAELAGSLSNEDLEAVATVARALKKKQAPR